MMLQRININQDALIKVMQFGFVADDFMHNRVTAKCYESFPDFYYPIKIYLTGFSDVKPSLFTTFEDHRLSGGEYIEHECTGVLKDAIIQFITDNDCGL